MNNRILYLLIAAMVVSLLGILGLQAYYLDNMAANTEKQFTFNVKKALNTVVNDIESEEKRRYLVKFQDLINSGGNIDTTAIINFYVKEIDRSTNKTLLYRNGILEENFKLSSALLDIGSDSINIKRIINERETKLVESSRLDNPNQLLSMMSQIGRISENEKILYDSFYKDFAYRSPLLKRTSKAQIDSLLHNQLLRNNIKLDYEFAIYSEELTTKIKTEDFENHKDKTFSVPIFHNVNDDNDYKLLVNFPEGNKFLIKSILGALLLSALFIVIIIIVFAKALLQLNKQKQISQIKTDFINNMTHEFKTPIATINLALDSIKNPKVINDEERVKRYLGMIRDENKRMHAQVENVLRISKLEKKEFNIKKEHIDLHDLIEDAISHIELIVEDKQGSITTNLEAAKSSVLANETHFTNVIVNILDNAVKYTPEDRKPKIHVETKLIGNHIYMSVSDNGSGMSKSAQKKVFDKFFREHSGNIHNVKGHGLGLAYVKQIIDDHHGTITLESEKEIGSTFTVKLPLIS